MPGEQGRQDGWVRVGDRHTLLTLIYHHLSTPPFTLAHSFSDAHGHTHIKFHSRQFSKFLLQQSMAGSEKKVSKVTVRRSVQRGKTKDVLL